MMATTDEQIYYTVLGGWNLAEHKCSDDNLEDLILRFEVEIRYWEAKNDIKKVARLTECLERLSNRFVEIVLLEEKRKQE